MHGLLPSTEIIAVNFCIDSNPCSDGDPSCSLGRGTISESNMQPLRDTVPLKAVRNTMDREQRKTVLWIL